MTDTKDTNPKDAFGSAKAPLGLVPDTGDVDVSMAFLEGALKYGRFNWRIAGVRASIYNDAMDRHRKKWWNGQDRDPLTRVKHLANLAACAYILMDAEVCGMLEDDRPPAMPLAEYIDSMQAHVAHLKKLFESYKPTQYSQATHPRGQTSIPPGMTYEELFGLPPELAGTVAEEDGPLERARRGTVTPPAYVGTGIRPPCTTPGCSFGYGHEGCCTSD